MRAATCLLDFLMKKPRLSFDPTYHELVQALEGPAWRPMFNPARECVAQECAKIEAEGGLVLNRLWTPVKSTHKKGVMSSAIMALLCFNLLGLTLLTTFCSEWLHTESLWMTVPAVFITGALGSGAGFLLMVFLFDFIFEHNRKHPTDSTK